MEATAQGVEDYLIDGLQFKLQPGATYITDGQSLIIRAAETIIALLRLYG